MFDTSVVRAHAITASRSTTLFASLLIHSTAIVAIIAATAASTTLPTKPPRQMELYRPAAIPQVPPPLGDPHGRRDVQTQPAVKRITPAPQPITAPTHIPDATPTAVATPQTDTDAIIVDGPSSGERYGSKDGVPDSTGPVDQAANDPGPEIHTPGIGGVTSARVISRVEPRFPPALVHGVRSAIVVVRCVIDQNGQIREPEVVASTFPAFNESVLSALHQWKFAPGMMRGKPVDTYFELTVKFQVIR